MAYSNRNYQKFWYPNNSNPIRYEDMEFSHIIYCLGKLQKRKEEGLPIFSEVAYLRLLQEIEKRVRKVKAGMSEQQAQAPAPTPEHSPFVIPQTNGQAVDLDQIPF